jgi:hypothetical protein
MHDSTVQLGFSGVLLAGTHASEPIFGAVTVFHLEGERFGSMQEVVELSLSEVGVEGLSADPVEPGAVVSLGFEAPGHPARRGEIIGCVRCEGGWKVGIEFDLCEAA